MEKIYCAICGSRIWFTDKYGDGEDEIFTDSAYGNRGKVAIGLYDDEDGVYWPVCMECLHELGIDKVWDSIGSQLSDGTLSLSDAYGVDDDA